MQIFLYEYHYITHLTCFQVGIHKLLQAHELYAPYDAVRWKFSLKTSSRIPGTNYRYPFLDICFYKEKGFYIQDIDPGFKFKPYKSDVFPLHYRPFENLSLPAPRDTKQVLGRNYDISQCVTGDMDHQTATGARLEVHTLPCVDLAEYFPFVHRVKAKGVITEMLKIGNTTLSHFENNMY